MTTPAWAHKKRDANEPQIVDGLLRAGATVERMHTPSDLLVGFRGGNYLLEVKTEDGQLTGSEQRFRDSWRGQYAVVRTIEEALEAIGASG